MVFNSFDWIKSSKIREKLSKLFYNHIVIVQFRNSQLPNAIYGYKPTELLLQIIINLLLMNKN